MQRKWYIFWSVVLAGIVLDQITKTWIVQNMRIYSRTEVIDGFFALVHYRNPGIAFGLFRDGDPAWKVPFFGAMVVVALALLVSFLRAEKRSTVLVPIYLGLVGSGAVGNLIDRIHLGSVVDFLLVYYQQFRWPAFNVADIAISIGAGLMALDLVLQSRASKVQDPDET